MDEKIREMVEADMSRCEQAQYQARGSQELYEELIARYSTFYSNFKAEIPTSNKVAFRDHPADYRKELMSIKSKLEALLLAGFRFEIPCKDEKVPIVQIENRNENRVTVNVTFDMVREQVEDMSALSHEQIQEVLLKISELEKIINSNKKRNEKWKHASKILLWIADKGVDVGIAMLPLLLKI